jgi:hypothetical protein
MQTNSIYRFLILPLLVAAFIGCDSEIDLYPDSEINEVVVYGILDCSSSDQIINIGRLGSPKVHDDHTFESLVEINPDTVQVSVQAWSGEIYGTYYLAPVLAESDPSSMAKFSGLFEPYEFMEYKLQVFGLNSGIIATGKTLPLSDPKVLRPGMSGMPISLGDSLNYFECKYSTVPRAMIYKTQVSIQYVEFTEYGDTLFQEAEYGFSPVYVDDPPDYIDSRINYGKEITMAFAPSYMLNVFNKMVKVNRDVVSRILYRMSFTVWAGDAVLRNYLQMADKYDDNRKQFFSNINGGYGLFASTSHTTVDGLRVDEKFLEMLANDETTEGLKFRHFLWTGRNGWMPSAGNETIPWLNSTGHEEK